jgi:beta-glucanase (GH16 family)
MFKKSLFILLVLLLAAGFFPAPAVPVNVAQAADSWNLVWSDEFNGASLDASKWTAVTNCGDKRNNEQQCYMSDDVSVSNGALVIKSEKRSKNGYSYTSGAVKTGSKFTTSYGKIEFNAMLPAGGQGLWPALWLYPTNAWPPEIDVLEAVNNMNEIHMTYHWGTEANHQQDLGSAGISNASGQFHTYGVEWEPGAIRWYIDGSLKRSHTGSDVTSSAMQIYMNVALGGDWPGSVGANTAFPQSMLVDYVRVYSKGSSSSPSPVPPPAPNPAPTPTPVPAPVTCPSAATNAFTACYYDNVNFTNPQYTRTEASVNNDWGAGSPASAIGADTFSAVYEGKFSFDSGTYNFTATADDGVRLYLDGSKILDDWSDHSARSQSVSKSVTSGTHTVRLEYYENTGDATAKLSWTKTSSANPAPTPTPAPIPVPPPAPSPAPAPTPPPSGAFNLNSLQYQGAFRFPKGSGNDVFEYGGTALSYDPTRDGLFAVGHDWYQRLAEISIPTPSTGSSTGSLPTASFLQNFSNPTNGTLIDPDSNETEKIGGTLVYNNQLLVNEYSYYDGDGDAFASMFKGDLNLSTSDMQGPYKVGDMNPGFYSLYMALVPASMQSAVGGPAVTGACCLSVIGRTSLGPALFAFNPADVGSKNPVPAKPLIYYPLSGSPSFINFDRPFEPNPSSANFTPFNSLTNVSGVFFHEASQSVVFLVEQGLGQPRYKDLTCSKNTGGYCTDNYIRGLWVYKLSDIVNASNPTTVKPSAFYQLPAFPQASATDVVKGGVAFDPAGKRLFITQSYGGDNGEPIVQVYKLVDSGSSSPAPTPVPPPAPVPTPVPTPSPTPVPPPTAPPANKAPIGNFDEITSAGIARGWTLDPDAKSTSNQVHFYIDGPAGQGGTLLTGFATNVLRGDVNSAQSASGDHGFEYAIPTQYKDGKQHKLYAYGIDTANSGLATLLQGSPKTFTIAVPVTPAPVPPPAPVPVPPPTPTPTPSPAPTPTPAPVPPPTTPSNLPKDGTLIKGKSNGTIYVMEYGKKRPFTSWNVFVGFGYSLFNVQTVSEVDSIPTGSALATSNQRHVRGTMVNDRGTVYYLGTDLRYPFPSARIFGLWGGIFSGVVRANDYDLKLPVGPNVAEPIGNVLGLSIDGISAGSIIKGSGPTLYEVLAENKLYPFATPADFLGKGHSFSNVQNVDDGVIATYQIVN